MFMHSSLVVYGRTTLDILDYVQSTWIDDQISLGDSVFLTLADSLLHVTANTLQQAVVIYLLYRVKQ